jgi:hypothetical protein
MESTNAQSSTHPPRSRRAGGVRRIEGRACNQSDTVVFPSFTTGQVYVVDPSRIKMLDLNSAALNAHLNRLGKGIMSHIGRSMPHQPDVPSKARH